MSGHVFHPGHEELHGVTVVVEGASGRTYVGRYHARGSRGVVMHDVGVHDPVTASADRAAWLARIIKFGVPPEHRQLIVPDGEAGTITRLADLQG